MSKNRLEWPQIDLKYTQNNKNRPMTEKMHETLKARELKDHAQAAAGSCFPSAGTPVQMWAESKRTTPEPEVCLFVSV